MSLAWKGSIIKGGDFPLLPSLVLCCYWLWNGCHQTHTTARAALGFPEFWEENSGVPGQGEMQNPALWPHSQFLYLSNGWDISTYFFLGSLEP